MTSAELRQAVVKNVDKIRRRLWPDPAVFIGKSEMVLLPRAVFERAVREGVAVPREGAGIDHGMHEGDEVKP